jgi:nitrous oxide reductase accessory protein NosL
MKHILLLLLIINISIFSNNLSDAKLKKLSIKGTKIAKVFCDTSKLPKNALNLDDALTKLKSSNACSNLDEQKLKLVAYSLIAKSNHKHSNIEVPDGAKCPVCGMFVYKYPKWAAFMEIDGKKHYFDGVKDMMKYYFFDGDFQYDRSKISKMLVTNYYTLEAINAKDAFYVYDSKEYGPMGRELIPFSTLKEAKNFIADHGGELMKFSDITPKNVMALDGVELK